MLIPVRTHTACVCSPVPSAVGLRQEYAAVAAAFTYRWSNGPVEGHVNRLKTIKRQRYGRANFDLLQLRVLHVA